MIYAGCHSFLGLGLEDRHVPTFWLRLYPCRRRRVKELKLNLQSLSGPMTWGKDSDVILLLYLGVLEELQDLPNVCKARNSESSTDASMNRTR